MHTVVRFTIMGPSVKHFGKTKVSLNTTNAGSPLYGCVFPKLGLRLADGKNDLSQKEAKAFCPPKCSVWRANFRGQWCFHYRPHKRHVASWCDFDGDSFKALQHGLKIAWRLFLDEHSRPEAECTIANLF